MHYASMTLKACLTFSMVTLLFIFSLILKQKKTWVFRTIQRKMNQELHVSTAYPKKFFLKIRNIVSLLLFVISVWWCCSFSSLFPCSFYVCVFLFYILCSFMHLFIYVVFLSYFYWTILRKIKNIFNLFFSLIFSLLLDAYWPSR